MADVVNNPTPDAPPVVTPPVEPNKDTNVEEIKGQYEAKLNDLNTKIKNYEKTVKELSKYKPVEKSDTEKALEDRLAKLEAREQEVKAKEFGFKLENTLKETGIPSELGKYLNVNSEKFDEQIKDLKAIWDKVTLNNNFEHEKHTATNTQVTKEQFAQMNYMDRAKLYESNPTLYKTLINN